MSALPALRLYHGQDWTTDRVAVAAVLDTLDRLSELTSPLFEGEDTHAGTLRSVRELCEDFAVELDVLLAELSPMLYGVPAAMWAGHEAHIAIRGLDRAAMLGIEEVEGMHISMLPPLCALTYPLSRQVDRLKRLVKTLDQ